jgi:hypothetical protein
MSGFDIALSLLVSKILMRNSLIGQTSIVNIIKCVIRYLL